MQSGFQLFFQCYCKRNASKKTGVNVPLSVDICLVFHK
jgi:hypothetical protein